MKIKNRVLITKKYLNEIKACRSGVDYWLDLSKERKSLKWLVQHAIESESINVKHDCFWLLAECLSCKNKLILGVYCAEDVLCIDEESYPDYTSCFD